MADGQSSKDSESQLPKDVLTNSDSPREDLIAMAVGFLVETKIRPNPVAKKIAFLRSKGLSEEEIEIALQRANDAARPPPLLPRVVRPVTSGAVSFPGPTASPVWSKVSGVTATTLSFVAIFYSAYNIYHSYIRPFWSGKSEVDCQLSRMEGSLAKLQKSIAENDSQIAATLDSIRESLAGKQKPELRAAGIFCRQENTSLNDIRVEIASLKCLLLNRHQFPPPPPHQSPVLPAWQRMECQEAGNVAISQASQSPPKADIPQANSSQDNCDEGRTGTRLTDVGNLPCGPAWVAPWNDDTVAGWADEVQETVTTQAVNMCE